MKKREVEKPKPHEEEWEPLVQPIVAADAVILPTQSGDILPSDVDGSYTGTSIDGTAPVQDSDDL